MRKGITVMILCAMVMMSFGCAAIFTSGRGKIDATSNPVGAEVLVNGEKMGQTPVTLRLKTKGEYTIVIRKDGFKEQLFRVTNKVGAGWIVLDVLCGLIPVIVDAATDSWYVFNERSFNAELERNTQRPCPTPLP